MDVTDWPEDLLIEEPDVSQLRVGVVLGAGGRPRLAAERCRYLNSGAALHPAPVSLTVRWE